MKYKKLSETAFQEIQINAGVILSNFTPADATIDTADIIGATTGGVSFTAVPEFVDFGEDIDNCPKNMMELKRINNWNIKLSGTYVTINATSAKTMIGAADVSDTKITPRNDLAVTDFADLWFVGDYSDKNGETNGGFIAIHMMNSLSTAGFSIQSSDNAKGQFAFEYTAHYSMDAQTTVPFEVYVKSGTDEE